MEGEGVRHPNSPAWPSWPAAADCCPRTLSSLQVNLRDCRNVSVFLAPSVVGSGRPVPEAAVGDPWGTAAPTPPLCSLSSHSSKASCRRSCPKGHVWSPDASPCPHGSPRLYWERAWTASGPTMSTDKGHLGRPPRAPETPLPTPADRHNKDSVLRAWFLLGVTGQWPRVLGQWAFPGGHAFSSRGSPAPSRALSLRISCRYLQRAQAQSAAC